MALTSKSRNKGLFKKILKIFIQYLAIHSTFAYNITRSDLNKWMYEP